MDQVQTEVTLTNGDVITSAWEDTAVPAVHEDTQRDELAAGSPLAIETDDGVALIPVASVLYMRLRTRTGGEG